MKSKIIKLNIFLPSSTRFNFGGDPIASHDATHQTPINSQNIELISGEVIKSPIKIHYKILKNK